MAQCACARCFVDYSHKECFAISSNNNSPPETVVAVTLVVVNPLLVTDVTSVATDARAVADCDVPVVVCSAAAAVEVGMTLVDRLLDWLEAANVVTLGAVDDGPGTVCPTAVAVVRGRCVVGHSVTTTQRHSTTRNAWQPIISRTLTRFTIFVEAVQEASYLYHILIINHFEYFLFFYHYVLSGGIGKR